MKKCKSRIFRELLVVSLVVLASATLVLKNAEAASHSKTSMTATPLYSFYYAGCDFHFYTADPDERANLKKQPGWKEYKQMGYVFRKKAPGTVPLYRLAKEEFGCANHFYTLDQKEAANAAANLGWTLEAPVGWISPTQVDKTTDLYRLYKPLNEAAYKIVQSGGFATAGDLGDSHFYTIDAQEKFAALTSGWQLVRTEGYVWTQPITLNSDAKPAKPAPLPPPLSKTEANLNALGCKRALSGTWTCETWAGGDACDAASKITGGPVTKCYTPRGNLLQSFADSFGRKPTDAEFKVWSDKMKAQIISYQDVMKALSEYLKTPGADGERKGMAYRSVYEAFGRVPTVGELNDIRDKIEKEGTTYAALVKGHMAWLLGPGNGAKQLGEIGGMVDRAYAALGYGKPTAANYQSGIAKIVSQKLTYKQFVDTFPGKFPSSK